WRALRAVRWTVPAGERRRTVNLERIGPAMEVVGMPRVTRPVRVLAALALALGAGVAAAGPVSATAPASAAPQVALPAVLPDGSVTVDYIVTTRDGDLFLEVVHPTLGGVIMQAPAILTYSPYSVLGRNG